MFLFSRWLFIVKFIVSKVEKKSDLESLGGRIAKSSPFLKRFNSKSVNVFVDKLVTVSSCVKGTEEFLVRFLIFFL